MDIINLIKNEELRFKKFKEDNKEFLDKYNEKLMEKLENNLVIYKE